MKKLFPILALLVAFVPRTWAQEGPVNVSSEQELRQFLNSNYTSATLTNVGLITLSQGELVVSRAVTIDLGGCNISGNNCRIFNVTASGNLTLTGSGYLVYGTADNGAIIYNEGTVSISDGLTISQGNATNGGAIYNIGTLTLDGGNIEDCTATNGGAIYNTGVLTINDGAIGIENYPNTATDGGAIYNVAGTVNINGGSISYNSANDDGGGIHSDGGSINMTGGSISYNSSTNNRGGVILTGSTTMNMSGSSSISDNIAANNDGGVYIGSNASLTINGGSITGNTAQHYAGIRVYGTLNMSSGNINENSATDYSGGVYIAENATLTMTGGSISDNTAPSFAGIRVYGTLNMSGGSVTGNTATGSYGGIRVESNGTMNMSGMPIVMGNLANGNSNNVYLPSGKKITVDDAFTTGATVGVTCASGQIFTSGFVAHSPNNSSVFTSDSDAYYVQISGGEAKLVTYSPPGVAEGPIPYLNVDATGNHGTAYCNSYTKMSTVSDNNPTLKSGWYVVDKSLTFKTRIKTQGTVNLILLDNTILTANKGISVSGAFHVWAQSEKYSDINDMTGVIKATANEKNYSGISGYGTAGYVYFHGGIVFAAGGEGASGISGKSSWGEDYTINVFGGSIIGAGGNGGAGIGGFSLGLCSSILITGGSANGIAGHQAAGIGTGYGGFVYSIMEGGYSGNPEDGTDISFIRIMGGNVRAIGTTGAGIGGGEKKDTYAGTPPMIYIEGGTVIASTNSPDAMAIGSGAYAWHEYSGNYLHIYDGAKVLASTSIHGGRTLRTAAESRTNSVYRTYRQMEIRPCDHPNGQSYSDNGNSLYICNYCYTKEPYTFKTAGNWNVAGNWLGSFMPGAGKNVAVKAAATIPGTCCAHVGNIDMQEGGSLTINDGGQLIHSNEGVTATVKRDITGYATQGGGWNFIATPIAAGTTPSTNNGLLDNPENSNYDLYYYDEPAHHWRNHKEGGNATNPNFTLLNGQGYLYAHSNDVELTFEGTLQAGSSNGTHTVSNLSHSASTLTGFNLVGNPFACNATIDLPAYVISGNTIVPYTGGSKVLAPCEGVMVQADADHESVTFTKVLPNAQANPTNSSSLQITLTQANTRGAEQIDHAIVSFNEGNLLGKFYFGEQDANIYLPQGGEEYAIVYSDKQGEMPLNFKANANGQYTITVNPENVELGYLHLIDNLTGADVDLLALRQAQGPASYTFTAKTSDYESRFKLVFAAADEAVCGPSEAFAFISDGNIIIKDGPSTGSGTFTLQVVDMMGRVIRTVGLSQCGSRTTTAGMTPGVYVLRLINGSDVKTQKIVIE